MIKKHGRYFLRDRRGGKEKWTALSADFEQAKQQCKLMRELGLGPDRRISVEEFSARWLEQYVATQRNEQGRKLATQRMRTHVLPVIGRLLVAQVTTADLRALRARLEKSSIAERTVAHVLSDVRCLFNYAVEEANIIDRSPFRPKLMPRLQDKVPYPLTEEEISRVLAAVPPQHQVLVRLALLTGLRYGELRGLLWSDVVLDDRPHLLVQRSHDGPTKSRKVREVPLTVEAEELLRGARRTSVFVFPGRFGGMMARDATSITRVVRRSVPGFHFHRTRDTFACRFMGAGGSSDLLRPVLGHSTVKQTERYGSIAGQIIWEQVRRSERKLPKTGDKAGDTDSVSLVRRIAKS
jgi:integrase